MRAECPGYRGAIIVPEDSSRTSSFEMPPLIPVRVDLLAERRPTTGTERPTYELELWRSFSLRSKLSNA